MVRTVQLKQRMMRIYLVSAHLYFLIMYLCLLLPEIVQTDEFTDAIISVAKEFTLLFSIIFFMYLLDIFDIFRFVFHPSFFREFFEIGENEEQELPSFIVIDVYPNKTSWIDEEIKPIYANNKSHIVLKPVIGCKEKARIISKLSLASAITLQKLD